MGRDKLRSSLQDLHRKILEAMATPGLNGDTKLKLAEAAQEALCLAQELEVATVADIGCLRAFKFLVRFVGAFFR